MKKLISALLCAAMVFSFAACSTSEKNNSSVAESVSSTSSKLDVKCNVYGLNGPSGMSLVPMMKDAEDNQANLDYNIGMLGSNDEIVAKIVNGEADIATVASNLASTLYKKTNGGISVIATSTLGVLALVTKGEEITDIKSLKGKTIYTTGQGANPEYIINYILEKNGLKPGEDVIINFVAQPTELVTTVVKNEKAIVVAPQPVATTITVKDTASKIALDFNKEWKKVSDTDLVMTAVIVRNEYLKQHKDAVNVFLNDYKESINKVNTDYDTTATLCEKYSIVTPAAIAKKAIPYCNIFYQDGKELKTNLSAYLEFLYEANPSSVGGQLPEDTFYYAK